MRKVLVTGGAGFIGSALCRHLVGAGVDVLNVDALTYAGNLASLSPIDNAPNYPLRPDRRLRPGANRGGASRLSSRTTSSTSPPRATSTARSTGSDAFIQTNILGTFSMLEAARDYWRGLAGEKREAFRFLHVSTDEVYGSLGAQGLFVEDDALRSEFALLGLEGRRRTISSRPGAHTYGLPAVISNCSNNYGPYHFPEKLIPLVILNAVDGKPLPVYGAGRQRARLALRRGPRRALAVIVARGRIGEKYNVGGRNERRNIDVVRTICALLDDLRPAGRPHAELIEFVTDRPGHDLRYAIDATKLERELGWRAAGKFRHRHREDGALVSRQRMVVAAAARQGLRGRAPRRARSIRRRDDRRLTREGNHPGGRGGHSAASRSPWRSRSSSCPSTTSR